jgi:hypothetical protein
MFDAHKFEADRSPSPGMLRIPPSPAEGRGRASRELSAHLPSPRSRTFTVSDERSPSGEGGAQRRVRGPYPNPACYGEAR